MHFFLSREFNACVSELEIIDPDFKKKAPRNVTSNNWSFIFFPSSLGKNVSRCSNVAIRERGPMFLPFQSGDQTTLPLRCSDRWGHGPLFPLALSYWFGFVCLWEEEGGGIRMGPGVTRCWWLRHAELWRDKKSSRPLGILLGSPKIAADVSTERWWYVTEQVLLGLFLSMCALQGPGTVTASPLPRAQCRPLSLFWKGSSLWQSSVWIASYAFIIAAYQARLFPQTLQVSYNNGDVQHKNCLCDTNLWSSMLSCF